MTFDPDALDNVIRSFAELVKSVRTDDGEPALHVSEASIPEIRERLIGALQSWIIYGSSGENKNAA